MAITVRNILVGEGTLAVAPTTTGDLVDIGATQEGAELSWEPDMADIEVDQFGDAIKVIQTKVKCSLKTVLAEATLVNLAIAWNYKTGQTGNTASSTEAGVQAASGGEQQMNIGIAPAYPNERKVQLVGPAPGTDANTTYTRTYTANRAISYNASSHKLMRAENVAFPVEFRLLPDPTQTGKEYGTIVDELAS